MSERPKNSLVTDTDSFREWLYDNMSGIREDVAVIKADNKHLREQNKNQFDRIGTNEKDIAGIKGQMKNGTKRRHVGVTAVAAGVTGVCIGVYKFFQFVLAGGGG